MKHVGSVILRSVSSSHTIHPCPTLVPTVERYNHCRLLFQRDILALHNGEVEAHYNIVQTLSKIVLSKAWLTKAYTMSYEGLYIVKGGVALDIPLCDSPSTLMTLQLLYDCYIQLSTLELTHDKTLHYNAHVPM